jgi:hypothetical protein
MHETVLKDKRFKKLIVGIQVIPSLLPMVALAIFVGALSAGADRNRGLAWPPTPVAGYLAFAVSAVVLTMWYFLPVLRTRRQVRKIARGTWTAPTYQGMQLGTEHPGPISTAYPTDAHKLLAAFMQANLQVWVILFWVATVALVIYTQGQLLALGVAGLALLLGLLRFPTRGRLSRWLEEQRGRLSDLRLSEGLPTDPADADTNPLQESSAEREPLKPECGKESF